MILAYVVAKFTRLPFPPVTFVVRGSTLPSALRVTGRKAGGPTFRRGEGATGHKVLFDTVAISGYSEDGSGTLVHS